MARVAAQLTNFTAGELSPRLDGRTIDYTKIEEQSGDEERVSFSYINENQLDDVQTQISTQSLEKSIFLTGCAGSGKTILALHRAAKIAELEENNFLKIKFSFFRWFWVQKPKKKWI